MIFYIDAAFLILEFTLMPSLAGGFVIGLLTRRWVVPTLAVGATMPIYLAYLTGVPVRLIVADLQDYPVEMTEQVVAFVAVPCLPAVIGIAAARGVRALWRAFRRWAPPDRPTP